MLQRLLVGHADDIIDGADMIKLAERELMGPLDEEARRLVSGAAQRVSIVTAVRPSFCAASTTLAPPPRSSETTGRFCFVTRMIKSSSRFLSAMFVLDRKEMTLMRARPLLVLGLFLLGTPRLASAAAACVPDKMDADCPADQYCDTGVRQCLVRVKCTDDNVCLPSGRFCATFEIGKEGYCQANLCTTDAECAADKGSVCAKRAGQTAGTCSETWFGICHAWSPAALMEKPSCVSLKTRKFVGPMMVPSGMRNLFVSGSSESQQPERSTETLLRLYNSM